MKKYKPLNYSFIILTFLLSVSCNKDTAKKVSRVNSLPYYNEASFTPNWLDKNSNALKTFHKIPEFSLTNQLGELVNNATFKDKIYVTDFFFTTCPGICPKMTANMMVLQEAFLNDQDVLLLSHSVTPKVDSVSVLKDYSESNGIVNSKWHLVTGNRKQIYDLGRHAYFAEEDLGEPKTEDDFLHTENFVLIDKNQHIRGIYNGLNKTSVQQLIADVQTLQNED